MSQPLEGLPTDFTSQLTQATEQYCDIRRKYIAKTLGVSILIDAAQEEMLVDEVMSGLTEKEKQLFTEGQSDVVDETDTPFWDVMGAWADYDDYPNIFVGNTFPNVYVHHVGLHHLSISVRNTQPDKQVLTIIKARIEDNKVAVSKHIQIIPLFLPPNSSVEAQITGTDEAVTTEDLELLQRVTSYLPQAASEGYEKLKKDYGPWPEE